MMIFLGWTYLDNNQHNWKLTLQKMEQMDKSTHRCKHICKPLQADPQTKVCKRASTSPTREKLFFKISFPSKIFRTATAQPTHKYQNKNLTMTAKPISELTFTTRQTERQLVTANFPSAAHRQRWKIRLNPKLRDTRNLRLLIFIMDLWKWNSGLLRIESTWIFCFQSLCTIRNLSFLTIRDIASLTDTVRYEVQAPCLFP